MSKNKTDSSPFVHNLNDLLANSNRYSQYINPLFKNLAFPPGLYIKAVNIEPNQFTCTPSCVDCVDDNLYSKLLTLAKVSDKTNPKKTRKAKKSKKSKKTKKK